MFIKIEYSQLKTGGYSVLNVVEIKHEENKTVKKIESANKEKEEIHNQKKAPENIITNKIEQTKKTIFDTISNKTVLDTASNKVKIFIPKYQFSDTSYSNLKLAATLLDSFLVRHPEYSRYILQLQAKELVENKNIKKFSRLALEQRINEELDKYLKEYYPEGSEHEINPYTGPGLQIPIDGLIDAIKKIFE